MLLAAILYFASISLFGFVLVATTQVPDSNWLIACIFPVFIAAILGFIMWVYAWSEFSAVVSAGSLIVPILVILLIRRWLSARDLFIAICAATIVGLVCARFAFIAADLG